VSTAGIASSELRIRVESFRMNPVDRPTTGVSALPLDDLAPVRLGTLMRRARKQQSLTRRKVAERIGTTASELRQCERGGTRAAPSLIVALAECYGDDLGAQFAHRTPIQLETRRIVVGTEEVTLQTNDPDELLSAYIGIVGRLRHVKPGERIALRAEDVAALSTSLGRTSEDVEKRIAELLDCTLHEARSLRSELLRRRVIAPTAGLLAGMAIIAGVGCAADGNHSTPTTVHEPAAHTRKPASKVTPATTHHTIAAPPKTSTTIAAKSESQVDVAGVTATVPEATTVPVIDIGNSLSKYSTTTRPTHVTSTTAKKPPPKPSKPPVTTATTTPPTVTSTTAP
jgi:transcriptional regulator with XRE-family HTH domain